MFEEDEDCSESDSEDDDEGDAPKQRKQRRTRGGTGGTGTQIDSRTRRLEKNRESARESRKRKKNYISSLEQKVASLESEVNRLRNIVQNYKEREKLTYFSHLDSMDQLLNGRQMLYDRLQSSIQENRDPTDMENIINALNIRTGSFGVERKNLINGLFKTIIEVSFPNFVKYLFWGS